MKTHFMPLIVLPAALALQPLAAQVQSVYSHGSPSPDEQYMLELINRARANPSAEGKRLAATKDKDVEFAIDFYGVNLPELKKEFSGYPARPPLAMNAKLLSAARRHSTDMAKKNFQSHTGSDGSTGQDRLDDVGYDFTTFNESIYSNLVPNPFYAHCGFNIDWGTGGTQAGLGHRMNIMNFGRTVYREVGIGVVSRTGADAAKYGKVVVTQNFGSQPDTPSFLLGVAYYDVDKDGICDPGEGLSGIDVIPASGDFMARTSSSGGYAIPFPGTVAASGTLAFTGGGLVEAVERTFTLDGENQKVDLRILSGGSFLHTEMVDSSATEGGAGKVGAASFRIARVGPAGADLKVSLARPLRGATGVASPADYKISAVKPAKINSVANNKANFTVVIPKGQRAATVKITPVKDGAKEPVESMTFKINPSPGYRTASPWGVTLSIKD